MEGTYLAKGDRWTGLRADFSAGTLPATLATGLVQAFVNAISAALDWMHKASTDEIVAAVPEEYYGQDRALYRIMVERNRGRVSDGKIPPEGAARVFRNLVAFEPTLKNAKVDVAATFDNSFIEKARSLRAK